MRVIERCRDCKAMIYVPTSTSKVVDLKFALSESSQGRKFDDLASRPPFMNGWRHGGYE